MRSLVSYPVSLHGKGPVLIRWSSRYLVTVGENLQVHIIRKNGELMDEFGLPNHGYVFTRLDRLVGLNELVGLDWID